MSQQEILVVEDELKIAALLNDYLSAASYKVTVLNEGLGAVEYIQENQPDCVILDVMLPGMSGLDICKDVRKFSMLPIVIITARVEEIDRLLGLELGADDYICKPFSPREVVVRIRNILRRVALSRIEQTPTPQQVQDNIEYRELSLNMERIQCLISGESISLTAVEFRMLFAMASRPGCIFSRDQLMSSAYTDTRVVSDRTIDTHIKNLRKKISEASSDELIHSIYGVGYKVE